MTVSLTRENLRELRVFFSQNPNLSRHHEYVFSNDSNVRREIWIPEGSIDNLWFSLVLLLSKLCIIVLWDLQQTLISWGLPVPAALKLTDRVRAILPEKNQIHIKIFRIFMKHTSEFWSLTKLVFLQQICVQWWNCTEMTPFRDFQITQGSSRVPKALTWLP